LGPALFRRRLHPVVEEDIILLVQRLVAGEAGVEIGRTVRSLVCLEGLVLPLPVTHVVRILAAPARTLLHHRVADEVTFDEATVGVLLRIALGIELSMISDVVANYLFEGSDRFAGINRILASETIRV
jgi:hypothetical protein